MLWGDHLQTEERAGDVRPLGLKCGPEAVYVALDEGRQALGGAAVQHFGAFDAGGAVLVDELDAVDPAAGGLEHGCHGAFLLLWCYRPEGGLPVTG